MRYQDAVVHNRLGSNTYKRLNLSLVGAAVFTLLGRSVAEPALDALGVALPTPYFCYFSMVTLLVLGPTFMFLENQTEGKLSSVPTSACPTSRRWTLQAKKEHAKCHIMD